MQLRRKHVEVVNHSITWAVEGTVYGRPSLVPRLDCIRRSGNETMDDQRHIISVKPVIISDTRPYYIYGLVSMVKLICHNFIQAHEGKVIER